MFQINPFFGEYEQSIVNRKNNSFRSLRNNYALGN